MEHLAKIITSSPICGTIYGGYVRDTLLQELHTERWRDERYKEAIKTHKVSYKNALTYNLPTVATSKSTPKSTRGRDVLPTDIDCVVSYENMGVFFKTLCDHRWSIRTMTVPLSKFTDYTCTTQGSNIYHYKMTVEQTRHRRNFCNEDDDWNPKRRTVDVDVLFIDFTKNPDLKPPFNQLDFQCNGLILTAAGYGVMEGHLDLEEIKKQIDDMRAVRGSDVVPQYRIDKMVEKKWTVELGAVRIISNKDWGN